MDVMSRDFDELAPGDRFVSRGRTVTEADVVAFAALTGDLHPQHVDAEWAARGPFGERIAHGMLVLSFATGLVPIDPERVIALRGLERATFKAPVRLGDTVHVEGRVDETTPIDARQGLVHCTWNVLNQRRRTVARVRCQLVWRRGGALASAAAAEDGVMRTVIPL
jgi:3-hydroxybutyryl-CoA dehydratase